MIVSSQLTPLRPALLYAIHIDRFLREHLDLFIKVIVINCLCSRTRFDRVRLSAYRRTVDQNVMHLIGFNTFK